MLTLTVLAGISAIVVLAWYPAPYFSIGAAGKYLLLMFGLSIGLGPMLTLVIYKPGKKGLKFDLAVISLLQLSALIVTTWLLYAKRPYFMVFAVDRFNVLTAAEFDLNDVGENWVRAKPWSGPLMLVATLPTDPRELSLLTEETVFEGKPDLEYRPRYWSLYSEDFGVVLERARTLESLITARPAQAGELREIATASGIPLDQLSYWPAIGRITDHAVILDRRDGAIVGSLAVNPWL